MPSFVPSSPRRGSQRRLRAARPRGRPPGPLRSPRRLRATPPRTCRLTLRPPTHPRRTSASVAELLAPPVDVGLQLVLQVSLHRRLLVLLERLLRDLARPHRRVAPTVARPALVVLRRREQRPVEALAEALERVHRAEEVAALSNLLVRGIGQRLLVDLEWLEHLVQHAQHLDVD